MSSREDILQNIRRIHLHVGDKAAGICQGLCLTAFIFAALQYLRARYGMKGASLTSRNTFDMDRDGRRIICHAVSPLQFLILSHYT